MRGEINDNANNNSNKAARIQRAKLQRMMDEAVEVGGTEGGGCWWGLRGGCWWGWRGGRGVVGEDVRGGCWLG